ncbi:IS256 family transposase [Mycoplasma seminis]|uniref:Mutator family transposase n=1 Tax=Mycoplasma seminis TaxID=512749 RepID=A0ABY9HAL3_9MOLU|nr:IS256 family transposase [Mycoplasma seminis]WLP85644.1 IS256 family transposase [Mycoplasma seminis]
MKILWKKINEHIRSSLKNIIELLISDSLTEFLQYKKYERSNVSNYRNGYYERTINTEYGKMKFSIARDRLNQFQNVIFDKYQRTQSIIKDLVTEMFAEGINYEFISKIVKNVYGAQLSKQSISNITDNLIVNIEKFKSRKLQSKYIAVFLDATYFPIKRETYSKEAIYIALGIDEEGHKEVLGFAINPTENTIIWDEILQDLKNRGVQEVGIFVTDGLQGLKDTVHNNFPNSKYQRCWVHIQRNVFAKVHNRDKFEIANDLKMIYSQIKKEEAIKEYQFFLEKWESKYPRVTQALINIEDDLFSFFDFRLSIRRTIYTTNIIESLNSEIKSSMKNKRQFNSITSLEKFLVTIFENYNKKGMLRTHPGFKNLKFII